MKRKVALIMMLCSALLASCVPAFGSSPKETRESVSASYEALGDPTAPDADGYAKDPYSAWGMQKTPGSGGSAKDGPNQPAGKTYPKTEYDYAYGIAQNSGSVSTPKNKLISFSELNLTRPNVTHPAADVVFGNYQNMGQLADSPNSWSFCKQNGDGLLFHEAYWLNMSSPQTTYGKKLGDILVGAKNLKAVLETGVPKVDFTPGDATGEDGRANAALVIERINRFMRNTGIKLDEITLEFYSSAVSSALKANGLAYNMENHYGSFGVPLVLKVYDKFYEDFIKAFPDMKIHHVGCPRLTGWKDPAQGGTPPTHWLLNPGVYKTSYQAYDITIPIFRKYAGKDGGRLVGWVHDNHWNMQDTGLGNMFGTHEKVVGESMDVIRSFGLKSTLLTNDWGGGRSGNTVETGGVMLSIPQAQADRIYWENSMKCIYNAQYQGYYHDTYLMESYYNGPYQMVPETKKYTFTNLVMTAIKYLRGTGQKLDLQVTDGAGRKTGGGVYAETPSELQTVTQPGASGNYTMTITNNGEVDCNPWLRAAENKNGATVKYSYKGKDITSQITGAQGFVFKDLFENADGGLDIYTPEDGNVLDTRFDTTKHGLKPGESIEIDVTVTNAARSGAVAICGFYNPQDKTNTIKDVVTIKF